MKKYTILSSLFILILLIGVSLGIYKKKSVVYLPLKKGDVEEAIYGLGKVESDQVYELKIGVMNNIETVFVKEGDYINKGKVFIKFEDGVQFKAPFDGTVTTVNYRDGEIALPQAVIIRMENLNKLYIEVSLEQDAALKVKRGQVAQIIFESLTGMKIIGTVSNIYPKNGEFIARIEAGQFKENILPGMTADVVINIGSKKGVLLIPVRAISDGRVLRLRNGKKKKIEVEIGHTDGLWAELVVGDLLVDDQLIVKGR